MNRFELLRRALLGAVAVPLAAVGIATPIAPTGEAELGEVVELGPGTPMQRVGEDVEFWFTEHGANRFPMRHSEFFSGWPTKTHILNAVEEGYTSGMVRWNDSPFGQQIMRLDLRQLRDEIVDFKIDVSALRGIYGGY